MDRLVEDVEAEQSLIDFGLKRTEQAVKRAKLFLDHALVPEEDQEGSGSGADEAAEKAKAVTILTPYFRDETTDGRLCRLHRIRIWRPGASHLHFRTS